MTIPDEDGFSAEEPMFGAEAVNVRIVEDTTKEEHRLEGLLLYDDPVVVPPLGGSGTTTFQLGVQGWLYDIRRVTVASFTAGNVNMYKNTVDDAHLWLAWSQAGTYTLDKAALLLNPNDILIFVATGIVGAVTPTMTAYRVRRAILAEYLM